MVAWPASELAVVALVGPHDGTVNDIHRQLLDALDVAVPDDEREKPPRCDEAGPPPPTDSDVALDIAEAVKRRGRGRRRPS